MAELRVKGTGTLKLFENDNTSSVTIASPASLGADRTVTLPDADVTLASGTMLATDGDGSGLSGVGKIGQVLQSTKTDTFTATSSTYTLVTDLSVSITPSATSSKILVLSTVGIGNNAISNHFRIYRDSTSIFEGDTAGDRPTTTFSWSSAGQYWPQTIACQYLDSPSSTSALAYAVYVQTDTGTAYVNRSFGDRDTTYYDPRLVSSITVMEVLA
jgi:hypothetical protein